MTGASIRWLGAALAGAAPVAMAQGVDPVGTTEIVRVTLALLAVLVLIVAGSALLKRLRLVQAAGGREIRLVESLSLGTRERIVLVEVGGQRVLLGVAPGRVQPLATLDAPRDPGAIALVPGDAA